ncbi:MULTISPECIES: LytR/AlgR family response regulator transcription factor [Hungatella]|uniref:Stage 0 sporulation protein A homolog n=1 Tax=Hungatella hathewayi TaxID=154046 RepID=A0AAW9WQF2_9FIRM|nr:MULTISPECIES: LytTR family DNA-binding domain-containing protein [Hungatella]MCQ4830345.1 LytTR family DNA-binding domain-containing protein [Hungatella sp. SL.1.14]MUB66462.1 response regulator [Hungatella hathewayi]CUQ52405.1 two-component response regulator [Hungatella hathewayi]
MIHIAIVEDEDIWADRITLFIQQYKREYQEHFQILRYRDGYEIADNYPLDLDIIFMDIEMKMMDGIAAAETIRKMDERVIIVFVTNMVQYAIKGYGVDALDYILKPISYIPFSETLKKAIRSLQKNKEVFITVKFRDGVLKICSSHILWIESQGHRLTFHTVEGDYGTTVYSMKEVEEKLRPEGFCRCNSGNLVNLSQVQGTKNGHVQIGDAQLLISRGKKVEFMKALVSFMTK